MFKQKKGPGGRKGETLSNGGKGGDGYEGEKNIPPAQAMIGREKRCTGWRGGG